MTSLGSYYNIHSIFFFLWGWAWFLTFACSPSLRLCIISSIYDFLFYNYREELLPMADIVTPNLKEASALLDGVPLESLADMRSAAKSIHDFGPRWASLNALSSIVCLPVDSIFVWVMTRLDRQDKSKLSSDPQIIYRWKYMWLVLNWENSVKL